MAKPYFTRRRRISLKKAHIVLVDKCVLFSGGDGGFVTTSSLRSGQGSNGASPRLKVFRDPCIRAPHHSSPVNTKSPPLCGRLFVLVGDGGFVTTSSLRSGQGSNGASPRLKAFRDPCIRAPHHSSSTNTKSPPLCGRLLCWWGMVDSDHRSQ